MSLNFLLYKFSCGGVAHHAKRSSISSGVSSASAMTRAAPPSLLLPFHWASWWQTCLEPCDAAVTQPADLCYPAVSVWDDNNRVLCRRLFSFRFTYMLIAGIKKDSTYTLRTLGGNIARIKYALCLGQKDKTAKQVKVHYSTTKQQQE